MTEEAEVLRLAAAAKRYGLKESTLRLEARRGNLSIFKIGNRHFTTLLEMERMVAKCRVVPEGPISGSVQLVPNETKRPAGPSVTAEDELALNAALLRARQLKEGWRTTSPKNTARHDASVHYLKSRSPT